MDIYLLFTDIGGACRTAQSVGGASKLGRDCCEPDYWSRHDTAPGAWQHMESLRHASTNASLPDRKMLSYHREIVKRGTAEHRGRREEGRRCRSVVKRT